MFPQRFYILNLLLAHLATTENALATTYIIQTPATELLVNESVVELTVIKCNRLWCIFWTAPATAVYIRGVFICFHKNLHCEDFMWIFCDICVYDCDILNAVLHFARDVRHFTFCVQFLDLCVKFGKKEANFENVWKQLKKNCRIGL